MKSRPIARYLLYGIVVLLLTVVYLSFHLPPSQNDNELPGGTRIRGRTDLLYNKKERIAILLPYAARGLPAVMPYLLVFCKGAAGAADMADLIFVHNGILAQWPRLQRECPPNVKFISLESNRGMAQRLLYVLDRDDEQQQQEQLVDLMASFIKINPYGLVEFKPALGHIFADYIAGYSHWGYSDVDILFGDLSRWITPDELSDYDIVTFSYGDQQRLYLRGQFTIHKNDPVKINQLWRKCDYLTHLDERFERILQSKDTIAPSRRRGVILWPFSTKPISKSSTPSRLGRIPRMRWDCVTHKIIRLTRTGSTFRLIQRRAVKFSTNPRTRLRAKCPKSGLTALLISNAINPSSDPWVPWNPWNGRPIPVATSACAGYCRSIRIASARVPPWRPTRTFTGSTVNSTTILHSARAGFVL